MPTTMLRSAAQKKLSVLWFAGAGVLGMYFLVVTSTGKIGTAADAEVAFRWYAQHVVPTLMLILGAFLTVSAAAGKPTAKVDPFYYRLCLWLSAFYLAALLLIVLLAPINSTLLDTLRTSSTYLPIFQGIVSYALGIFFVKAAEPAKS